MRNSIGRISVLMLLFLLVIAGCNRSPIPGLVPVQGVVLLDGAPVEGVSVMFSPQPESTSDRYATCDSAADGSFQLDTIGYKGALPGTYRVAITKTTFVPKVSLEEEDRLLKRGRPVPEPDVIHHIPEKYSAFHTSGIAIEIGPKGNKDIRIELKSDKT